MCFFQLYLYKMLSEMLKWNNFDLYYLSKRIRVPSKTLLLVLRKKRIPQNDVHKIICYYLSYSHLFTPHDRNPL